MNILVVSPHPDDETLGAGGSICKFKTQGDKVYWLNVTDVVDKKDEYIFRKGSCEKRKEQIEQIVKYYNFDGFFNLKYSPSRLTEEVQSDLIKDVEKVFDEVHPGWIILPDYNDAHSDHKFVFEAGLACSKIFRRKYIRRIFTMEVLSETNFGRPYDSFRPNFYIDISDYMNRKMEALQIYDSELEPLPFPRNSEAIKAQAILRGTESGCMYAEAFRLIKMIE